MRTIQSDTTRWLENFGWELKFIRHPLFQQPVPIVFDADGKTYAVLEADAMPNKNPPFRIRE